MLLHPQAQPDELLQRQRQDVLIVEDDPPLAAMLGEYLEGVGFQPHILYGGRQALDLLRRQAFDAVILDLSLPDVDGLEVCRELRAWSRVPVLMLTARGDCCDRVLGLELGADDYLPKPFLPRELLARLRAVLRSHAAGKPSPGEARCFGRLTLEIAGRQVLLDGQPRALTAYQFDLLAVLVSHAGRVLSRDALIALARREGRPEAADRSIDLHISRIRAEIEDDPRKPRRILTVRGAGYLFARQQS
jgi:two-component system, OmpR family, phosphate regulon response regulator OmpR